MNDADVCFCGHIRDEHDGDAGECEGRAMGEPCACVYFDLELSADDPAEEEAP